MKKPQKKECNHLHARDIANACKGCVGYNQACDDWEKWLKEQPGKTASELRMEEHGGLAQKE
jgi:hypothetical protein